MRAEQTGWGRGGALPAKTPRRPRCLPGAPRGSCATCPGSSLALPQPGASACSCFLGAGARPAADWLCANHPHRVRPTRGRNRHIRSGKSPPEPRLIRLFPNMESMAGASGGLAEAGGGRGPHLPGPAMLRQRCGCAAHGGGQTCTGRGALSPGQAGPPAPAFPGARL